MQLLTEDDKRVLVQFPTYDYDGFGPQCIPFAPIQKATGWDRKKVRRIVRKLARKGLVEFQKGLWTEDGYPGGAGYGLTKEGRKMICPKCDGSGKATYDQLSPEDRAKVGFGAVFPCSDCGGSGIVHCCEGERPSGNSE